MRCCLKITCIYGADLAAGTERKHGFAGNSKKRRNDAALCSRKFYRFLYCGSVHHEVFHFLLRWIAKRTLSKSPDIFAGRNGAFFHSKPAYPLVTRIQTILVMGLQVLVRAPIMAAGALINISRLAGGAWQCTAVTAVGVIGLTAFIIGCVALALPKQKTSTDTYR